MTTDLVIPEVGESITSGVVAAWLREEGTYVEQDEPVLELETDKITQELVAPASGVLKHLAGVGDEVDVGAVVGVVDESASPPAKPKDDAPKSNGSAPAPAPAETRQPETKTHEAHTDVRATPLAVATAKQTGVSMSGLTGTGIGGKIRERDVLDATQGAPTAAPAKATPAPAAGSRGVRREKMTPLRQRVAARLVQAQHNAAMLTTFNECDMSRVMQLRKQYKETFQEQHGVGLGFMSFFVKAVVTALQKFPAINASIVDGETPEVEYHDYCDISVAVSSPKGLVVPVLRDSQDLSFAQVEAGIKDLAIRARDGKLGLDELQGGTFTITNGGIFGSLMSTPILNPPQTGILGMHTIKKRAVEDPDNPGQAVIRPMMYLALSYDHRLVDGAEAVQFLVSIKESIESPDRLLLGLG